MKNILTLLLLSQALFSCTIASYSYRAEGNDVIFIEDRDQINVFIESHPRDFDKYSQTTLSYLKKHGINSRIVESPVNATLHIQIEKDRYNLGQEYITGLSFGIIPSWGNKKNIYTYWIYYKNTELAIYVDEYVVNHLLLTPFCLIELPFIRETSIFKKALSTYIDTQQSAAPDAPKPARP